VPTNLLIDLFPNSDSRSLSSGSVCGVSNGKLCQDMILHQSLTKGELFIESSTASEIGPDLVIVEVEKVFQVRKGFMC
jgi:hypothetical protein